MIPAWQKHDFGKNEDIVIMVDAGIPPTCRRCHVIFRSINHDIEPFPVGSVGRDCVFFDRGSKKK